MLLKSLTYKNIRYSSIFSIKICVNPNMFYNHFVVNSILTSAMLISKNKFSSIIKEIAVVDFTYVWIRSQQLDLCGGRQNICGAGDRTSVGGRQNICGGGRQNKCVTHFYVGMSCYLFIVSTKRSIHGKIWQCMVEIINIHTCA